MFDADDIDMVDADDIDWVKDNDKGSIQETIKADKENDKMMRGAIF
jgi:hypothetical protein